MQGLLLPAQAPVARPLLLGGGVEGVPGVGRRQLRHVVQRRRRRQPGSGCDTPPTCAEPMGPSTRPSSRRRRRCPRARGPTSPPSSRRSAGGRSCSTARSSPPRATRRRRRRHAQAAARRRTRGRAHAARRRRLARARRAGDALRRRARRRARVEGGARGGAGGAVEGAAPRRPPAQFGRVLADGRGRRLRRPRHVGLRDGAPPRRRRPVAHDAEALRRRRELPARRLGPGAAARRPLPRPRAHRVWRVVGNPARPAHARARRDGPRRVGHDARRAARRRPPRRPPRERRGDDGRRHRGLAPRVRPRRPRRELRPEVQRRAVLPARVRRRRHGAERPHLPARRGVAVRLPGGVRRLVGVHPSTTRRRGTIASSAKSASTRRAAAPTSTRRGRRWRAPPRGAARPSRCGCRRRWQAARATR